MADSDPKTPSVEIEQVNNGYFLTVRYPAEGVDTAKRVKLVFSALSDLISELQTIFGEDVILPGLPAPKPPVSDEESTEIAPTEGDWEDNDDLSDFFDESA